MKKRKSKRRKSNINILIACLLGIAVTLLFFGISELISSNKKIYMNEIINSSENYNKKSFVTVHTNPYVFAEYEGMNEKFYIIKDADYLYIVLLSDREYQNIMARNLTEKPYTIYGFTKELPQDVRKFAKDAYNDLVESEDVTETNFDLFFGSIYLDVTNIDFATNFCFSISGILLVITAIIAFRKRGVLCQIKKSKKV